MEEIKEDNKWNDILCSWTERQYIGKMSILPKSLCKFKVIFSKFQWYFYRNRKKSKNHMGP